MRVCSECPFVSYLCQMHLQRHGALFVGAFFVSIFSICSAQVTLPVDFESGTVTEDFTDFDGGTAEVVPNPAPDAFNESATVARIVRDGGAPWSGSILTLDAPLDFSEASSIRMKVWSPRQGVRIKLKLEGPPELSFEVDQWNTTQGGWEEMHWNFTNALSMTFDKLVFMFDFELVGDGTDQSTFYFDDVEQVDASNGLAQIDLPCTFEDEMVDPTTYDFWGAASQIVEDPTNPDNHVVEVVKMPTAVSWAGTTIGTIEGFANPIPFTEEEKTISVRVWTPEAGTPILLKAEMTGGNPFYTETIQYTSQEGWETLEFNFGNELPGTPALDLGFPHQLLAIFFGFGEEGVEGGTTYYFDNVYFGEGPVVGIDDAEVSAPSLFPNPLRQGQPLMGRGFDSMAQVRILDAMGRTAWVGAIHPNGATLGLERGAYTVLFEGPQGQERQRLLIH